MKRVANGSEFAMLALICAGCSGAGSEANDLAKDTQAVGSGALPATLPITVTPSTGLADLQTVQVTLGANVPRDPILEMWMETGICRTGADLGPINERMSMPDDDCIYRQYSFDEGGIVSYANVSWSGVPFTCPPGACNIVMKPVFSTMGPAVVPISFRDMGPPKSGTLELGSASADKPFSVSGKGWASLGTVRVAVCPVNAPPGLLPRW